MTSVLLRLEGKDTDKLTQSLEQFLSSEWEFDATVKQVPVKQTGNEDDKDWATVGMIAGGVMTFMKFVIDLPKFLDASADLAKRAKAKQRLEKLVEWTEANLTDPSQVVWLEVNGIPYPVKTERLGDILNAMQD